MYREWRIGVSVAAIMAMRGNPVMDHASRSQHQTQADASSISSTNPTASSPLPTQTPPWGALWVMALGLAMIVLDSSIVNVSIPTIIDDIGINLTDAQWVTSLYNIVLAALLLPFGKLGDARGRKLVFQVGTVIFVASSTLAAASQGAGMLLAARVLQGIGGAMIMPNTLSTVSALFRGKYRAAAFGVWGAVMSSAAALGPLLGGVFTETLGWRWIFLVNLPLGIAVFVSAIFLVPQTGGDASVAGAADAARYARSHRVGVDIPGVVLSALTSALLVFGLIEGETYGWWKQTSTQLKLGGLSWNRDWLSPVPICLIAGALLMTAFIVFESARGKAGRPVMLDMTLFRIRTFSWGNLAAAAIAAGEFALVFMLPLYLINARGLNTLQAGAMLAVMGLGSIVAGAQAHVMAAKLTPAGVIQLGLVIEIIAVALVTVLMPVGLSVWWQLIPMAAYGLGLGFASAQLTSVVLSEVPIMQSGEGSATQSTVRQLGTAVGSAISGASLAMAVNGTLPARLESLGLPAKVGDGLAQAVSGSAGGVIGVFRSGDGPAARFGDEAPKIADAMTSGFIEGGQWTLLVAGIMLFIGLLASVAVRRAASSHNVR